MSEQHTQESKEHKKDQSISIPGAIIIAGALIAGAVFLSQRSEDAAPAVAEPRQEQEEQEIAPEDISIDLEGWPSLGDPDAPVVIVEYSDFSCSFCGRFWQETLSSIKSDYIDEGQVRFVYKDFVVVGGDRAAEAAHCAAEQDAFWEYHDMLFENQSEDKAIWSDSDVHREYARELGLDEDALVECFEERRHEDKVVESTREAAQNGGRGTPYFLINDRPLSGAQPYSAFRTVIELELKDE